MKMNNNPNEDFMKNTAHFILQGKGGVGKSLVSSMLAQYIIERGGSPACADTDAVNQTFHQIKSLGVVFVEISENGRIMQSLFDPLFEKILGIDNPIVVDNGASTFLPMLQYLHDSEMFNLLYQSGKQVFIHTVVTGGAAKDDTAAGAISLLNLVEGTNAKIVIWQNEFWGIPLFNGNSIENTPFVKKNHSKIAGIVKIIDRNSDAFTADLRAMYEKHLTYADVKLSTDFHLISKSRIFRVFNDVYSELDKVDW